MSETKHTLIPWEVGEEHEAMATIYSPSADIHVCVCHFALDPGAHSYNARFILKSVNHHHELVAACKELLPLAEEAVDMILNAEGKHDAELATKVCDTLRHSYTILAKIKES